MLPANRSVVTGCGFVIFGDGCVGVIVGDGCVGVIVGGVGGRSHCGVVVGVVGMLLLLLVNSNISYFAQLNPSELLTV